MGEKVQWGRVLIGRVSTRQKGVKIEGRNANQLEMLFFQPSVTLVTQASLDRLAVLERSLSSWRGPVSIAVYIPARGSKGSGGGGGGSGGPGGGRPAGGGEETEWQR